MLILNASRNPSEALILPGKFDFPEVASFRENAIFVEKKYETFQILTKILAA